MNAQRRAVVVDHYPLWLNAVEQVLSGVSVDVVGKATGLAEASALVEELRPELVVVETSMSDGATDGLSWLAGIGERFPEIKFIVLSTSDAPADIDAALAAGAVAFVMKRAHPDDLAVAVRQAYEHSIYLPGSKGRGEEPVVKDEAFNHADLTRRELEILRLVAEGYSNAELARMLWVTEQTVKFHLSNTYRKLNVANRTEASRWAQLHGLLPSQGLRSTAVA